MLRTIIWYSDLVGSLFIKLLQVSKIKSLAKSGDGKAVETYVHKKAYKWARSRMEMSGSTVKISGEENVPKEGAVLFVSNHQSNFDIPLFMGYIDKPKGYIAKIEMMQIPVMRTWMRFMNCVFMERGNLRKATEAIIQGIDILKSGYSLVLFPEGTRSKGDNMGEFKAGGFKLATKPKVPIIPVTIKGTYKIMEQNHSKIKPAEVEMIIHPPVYTDNLTREEETQLPDKIKDIIASAL